MNTNFEKVEIERWKVAQEWERDHWLRSQRQLAKGGKNYIWKFLSLFGAVEKYRGDDRNGWWRDAFEAYKDLPSSVENAIEVGCGPYTNMRLIMKQCQPRHLVLSDPLIRTYVKFKMTFLREMYESARCSIDDHPLESLPYADRFFHLVVKINVLDHVHDARACMESVLRIAAPGGYIVIGQDLTNEEDAGRHPEGIKIGHPITLDEEWFDEVIGDRCEQVYRKLIPRENGWAPEWHYATLVYIGRKR